MTWIRHVATCHDNDLFATAEFERRVTVWSLRRREKVAVFDTVLDFGGTRLALSPGDPPILIAGAYNRRGIVGYNALNGSELWSRRDLKKVQCIEVAHFDGKSVLTCAFEGRRALFMNPVDGQSCDAPIGLRWIRSSNNGRLELHEIRKARQLALWDHRSSEYLWKMNEPGAGAVAERDVLLLGSSPPSARCVDLAGRLQWEWQDAPSRGDLFADRAAWSTTSRTWWLLASVREKGCSDELVKLSEQGVELDRVDLSNNCWEKAFTPDGNWLITNFGEAWDLERGRIGWQFVPFADASSRDPA